MDFIMDERVSCCFCAQRVDSDQINPAEVIVVNNWDKPKNIQEEQVFWAHIQCFKDKMHVSYQKYFFLDVIG